MKNYKPIIVLDDDPTGTQTVHGVPVITEWSLEAIQKEFAQQTPLFYVLTNSRALVAKEANKLAQEIGQNIAQLGQDCWLISRSDSTLRGHFPNEIEALAQGLGWKNDFLTVLIPAFLEGKRFTKDDVHYLEENGTWTPVAQTPYAQDTTFGFKHSNLKAWVEEKTKGRIKVQEVDSVSIEAIEQQSEVELLALVNKANKMLIVNALNSSHLQKMTLVFKRTSKKIIFRTAASWVAAMGDIHPKPLLKKEDLVQPSSCGGLVVVGSHVPKTTVQLSQLLTTNIEAIEFEVASFLENEQSYLEAISQSINWLIGHNQDVVLFTSRQLITGLNQEESLQLSVSIAEGLNQIVNHLRHRPRFLIAKGGITSSDLATKGLGVQRAIVLGQIATGVPVWALGSEAKFPNMPYIVFPGNVGEDSTLKEIYEKLK